MCDYARAEPLFEQALQIRRKALGPEHPGIARSLHNLALLYVEMGDYARAEPLYQQALQIYQKVLGPDNPNGARVQYDASSEDCRDRTPPEGVQKCRKPRLFDSVFTLC